MVLTTKQHNFLVSAIRRLTMWNKEANEALKLSRVSPGRFQCNNCKNIFKQEEINRDHIEPIVPFTGFPMRSDGSGKEDWNTYIDRAIVDRTKYQILCIPCHDVKSALEDSMREKISGVKRRSRKRRTTKKVKKIVDKKNKI